MTQVNRRAEGLPPSARMQKRGDFLRCQRNGLRHYGRSVLLVHSSQDSHQGRLGLVVTKKTGNAVVRNRWKRVIRDTFRRNHKLLNLKDDWVVMVKRTVQGLPPQTLPEELVQLWKRAMS